MQLARALELLDRAVEEPGDLEARALVVLDESRIAAVAIFGVIAGAVGATRLHALAWHGSTELATQALSSTIDLARTDGSRFVLAELPDEPTMTHLIALLTANGFRHDGRIADFVRDGVALLFLRRTL